MGKPFLSKEFVLKRVNAALKRSRSKVTAALKEARDGLKKNSKCYWAPKRIKRLENKLKGFAALEGIPYKSRKGVFEGNTTYGGGWYSEKSDVGTVSHGLDLETGRAHSYEWYDLGKIINGKYVVNSFHYSSETIGHVYNLKSTLKILGVKFTELEAPKGLQDLDSARKLQLDRIADATIGIEFGRQDGAKWRRANIRDAEKELAKLAKFGIKTTKKMRDDAIESARKERTSRLDSIKRGRESSFRYAYQKAVADQDLVTITKLISKDKRRTDKGLPSLLNAKG